MGINLPKMLLPVCFFADKVVGNNLPVKGCEIIKTRELLVSAFKTDYCTLICFNYVFLAH